MSGGEIRRRGQHTQRRRDTHTESQTRSTYEDVGRQVGTQGERDKETIYKQNQGMGQSDKTNINRQANRVTNRQTHREGKNTETDI